MKTILKKVYKRLLSYETHTVFLTIDNNYISGAVYKDQLNFPKNLVYTANSLVKGVERSNIASKTLFAHSIGECIDKLEESCQFRVKNLIVTLIGFNSRSIEYPLSLKNNQSSDLENVLKHINIKDILYSLGDNYFITNMLPLNFNSNNLFNSKENSSMATNKLNNNVSNIDFLVAGFKKDFIYDIFDIFYNLSLNIKGFFFAPFILPLIVSTNNNKKPVIIVSQEYSLLYSENIVKFIPFGFNLILEKIAKKSNIPYGLVIQYSNKIKEILLQPNIPFFYRMGEFVINDIKKIVFNTLKEWFKELFDLINKQFSNKHNTIIIINDTLKKFKEYELIDFKDSLNIEFYDNKNNLCINSKTFITDWINEGAFHYFNSNYKKDLALLKFKELTNNLFNNM